VPARATVLLPVRDCAQTVGAAVDSVLQQRFADFTLLVIDDGSTDETADVVAARDSDDRVTLVRGPARGLIGALNAGLERVESPYLVRMDGDDLMHPDRIGAQVQALDGDASLALVSSRVALDPPDSGMARYVEWLNGLVTPEQIAAEIYVEAPVCHPSVTLRTEVLRAVGGYRDRGWAEDYDLWLRLHQSGARMAQVPRTLHVWRDHDRRLTRTDPRYAPARFFDLKAHFLARVLDGRARIWGAGRDGRRLARALVAEGVVIEAFIDIDPKKIGGVRRGDIPIIGPDGIGDGAPIISAVGVRGARADIRRRLTTLGLEEGADFICAA